MIFLIIIGFPAVVWAIVCGTGCRGNFHRFPGSFHVVGGDLGCRFCWVVSVPVFLYEFHGVVEVLDRFPGVISTLIAFPVDQEFVPVVLVAVVKYQLCFPFVTGLFLSNENTIGPVIDLLAHVLREASRDRR